MAFVPVADSDQAAPSSRQMSLARCITAGWPWRHSTRPSSSVTTMICRVASAMTASPSRSSGITPPMGVLLRRCSISSVASSLLSVDCSGSTPLRSARFQDASISARGPAAARSPASLASRARWTRRVVAAEYGSATGRGAATGLASMTGFPNEAWARSGTGHRTQETHPCVPRVPLPRTPHNGCNPLQLWWHGAGRRTMAEHRARRHRPRRAVVQKRGGWCRVGAAPPSVVSRGGLPGPCPLHDRGQIQTVRERSERRAPVAAQP